MKHSHNPDIQLVDLKKIRIDGGTQPREAIDETVVSDYFEAYEGGVELPPALCFFDGSEYWLADGFHRYHARRKGNYDNLETEVRPGTKTDAQWAASAANKTHGLKRTNADKRRAVEMALSAHPRDSDRAIAEHVGVSNTFVGELRAELSTVDSSERVGRDGVTRKLPSATSRPAHAEPKNKHKQTWSQWCDSVHKAMSSKGVYVEGPDFHKPDQEPWKSLFADRFPAAEVVAQMAEAQAAAAVKSKAPSRPEKPKDELGREIHPKAAQALLDGPDRFKSIIADLHALKREIMALPDDGLGRELRKQSIERDFKNIVTAVAFAMPFTSCPMNDPCTKQTCKLCHGAQWVTKEQWDNIPKDRRT